MIRPVASKRYYQANLKDNKAAQDYLKGRGIDGATAKRFGIGARNQIVNEMLGQVKAKAAGRADMGAVGAKVKERLGAA